MKIRLPLAQKLIPVKQKLIQFKQNLIPLKQNLISIKQNLIPLKQNLIQLKQNSKKPDIAIVGVGGLGSVACKMLARTVDNDFVLFDDDIVNISNLHRQILYTEADIGEKKVDAAVRRIHDINPKLSVTANAVKLTKSNLNKLDARVVLDCADNLKISYLLNRYCVKKKIPLIFATVAGDHGFVKVIDGDACLNCFYKQPREAENSGNIGVLNTAVTLASSIQLEMAMQILKGQPYEKSLISFDIYNLRITKIKVLQRKDCGVCR